MALGVNGRPDDPEHRCSVVVAFPPPSTGAATPLRGGENGRCGRKDRKEARGADYSKSATTMAVMLSRPPRSLAIPISRRTALSGVMARMGASSLSSM